MSILTTAVPTPPDIDDDSNTSFYETSQDVSARLDDITGLRKVRTWRHYKVYYRTSAFQVEVEKSAESDEELVKRVRAEERKRPVAGLSFRSPSGKRLVRFVDDKRYLKPTSFDFDVNLPVAKKQLQPFTFRGRIVAEFSPVLWGAATLTSLQGKMAFAKGFIDGGFYLFYSEESGIVSAARTNYKDHQGSALGIRTGTARDGTTIVTGLLGNDYSTFTLEDLSTNFIPRVPGLAGDLDAVLNYGGYLKSRQPGGFSLWRRLYRNKGSQIPPFMVEYMLSYPNFHAEAVEIPTGVITRFRGFRLIGRLRLVDVEPRVASQVIDLTGRVPRIYIPPKVELDLG